MILYGCWKEKFYLRHSWGLKSWDKFTVTKRKIIFLAYNFLKYFTSKLWIWILHRVFQFQIWGLYLLYYQIISSGSYFYLTFHFLLIWKSSNIVRRISVMVTNLFWACLCSSSNWFCRFRTCWLDSSFKVTCWEQSPSVAIMKLTSPLDSFWLL